jgi:hypothetical protein
MLHSIPDKPDALLYQFQNIIFIISILWYIAYIKASWRAFRRILHMIKENEAAAKGMLLLTMIPTFCLIKQITNKKYIPKMTNK